MENSKSRLFRGVRVHQMRTVRSVDKSDVLTSKKPMSKSPVSVAVNETTKKIIKINLTGDSGPAEEIVDNIQISSTAVTKPTTSNWNSQNLVSFTNSNCSLGANETIIIDDDSSPHDDKVINLNSGGDKTNSSTKELNNCFNKTPDLDFEDIDFDPDGLISGTPLFEILNDFDDNIKKCSADNEESDSAVEIVWLGRNDTAEVRIGTVRPDQLIDSSANSNTKNNKITNEQLIREADLVFKKVQEIEERKNQNIEKKKRKKKEDERKMKEKYNNEIETRQIMVDDFFKSSLCEQIVDEHTCNYNNGHETNNFIKQQQIKPQIQKQVVITMRKTRGIKRQNERLQKPYSSYTTTSQNVEKKNTSIEEEATSPKITKRSVGLCPNGNKSTKQPVIIRVVKSAIAARTNTINNHQTHYSTVSSSNPTPSNVENKIFSSDASISHTTSLAEYFQSFRDSDDDQ